MKKTIYYYANKKLYLTNESRYCTLKDVYKFIKTEQEIEVIDFKTKNIITDEIAKKAILKFDLD